MNDILRPVTKLPPEQEAIKAKCFHPTGTFVEFKKEEVEQLIPQRFEKIVRQYPERIAVKTKATQVIFRVRETFHVQFPLRALFENPTVAGLAVQITQIQAGHCASEMAELVADLESISDKEAQLLLDHESGKVSRDITSRLQDPQKIAHNLKASRR